MGYLGLTAGVPLPGSSLLDTPAGERISMRHELPGSGLAADRSPWITRIGVAAFLTLALGLILLQGPGRALGYGSSPSPTCVGYHTVCKAQVESLRTTPRKPVAGRGFTVAFNTSSG